MPAGYNAQVGIRQGATGIFVDTSGTLDVSSGKLVLPGNLNKGFIPLDIFGARILTSGENFINVNFSATGVSVGSSVGGLLNAGSTPTLTMFSTVAQAAYIGWASGQTQAVAFPPVPIPPDFASAGGLEIHAFAERTSDNASNNVLDMRFWNATGTTEQGTTGSTLTTTPAEVSIAVSSAEVGAHPGFWNVQFVPGTHTNNAVRVYAGWLEYTRKSS